MHADLPVQPSGGLERPYGVPRRDAEPEVAVQEAHDVVLPWHGASIARAPGTLVGILPAMPYKLAHAPARDRRVHDERGGPGAGPAEPGARPARDPRGRGVGRHPAARSLQLGVSPVRVARGPRRTPPPRGVAGPGLG